MPEKPSLVTKSSLARMAGNIAAAMATRRVWGDDGVEHVARLSVMIARAIVSELEKPERSEREVTGEL